ncbi:glycoside hydrolase family 19 protein [Cypionkella sinensis]|uniref:Peptidoglycan-binding protein n=1 Tax=Cypionkella sinensis TaxID=1756043 RepID=A0ABV7IYP2_9RHOB
MIVTPAFLSKLAGAPVNANMVSTISGLVMQPVGLDRPHRLAHYLGQLAHESGCWKYDREIWGPTPAQTRYDTRTDLGNTAALDGDGYRFRGRGPIQITGRANYAGFTAWCRKFNPSAPDFTASPDAVVTDPWEGLGPIWYWDTRKINKLADAGDITAVTKCINGGTNGLTDRIRLTVAASLFLSGSADAKSFQRAHGLKADGMIGPITRSVLHKALTGQPVVTFAL